MHQYQVRERTRTFDMKGDVKGDMNMGNVIMGDLIEWGVLNSSADLKCCDIRLDLD